MPAPSVVVIGSFVQDLTFRSPEFPRPGETVIGQFVTGPGGKGSNQAVAAARAGGQIAFIGAVGKDAFGEGARSFQKNEGITCLMAEKTETPTGAAGILVNSHGQNEIIVALNANDALTQADIDAHADVIRGAKVVVSQLETSLIATTRALHHAREGGAIAILNPAPMRPDFDPAVLADVEIFIPNETEFAALVRQLPQINDPSFTEDKIATLSDAHLHALCQRFGPKTLIVTLGSRGCFISRAEGHALIPAMRGIKAIDTTGAGDAFVGSFATALAELGREGIEKAARFANAGAALSVTKPGTAPAMPHRPEIDALLAAQS